MSEASLLLLGIGTAGCSIARGIRRAYGENLRYALADTDATAAPDDENFILLGGDRLSGRGTGGDLVAARLAAEDSIANLDSLLEGVRLVVIVTALGGGTGGGATLEAVKRLAALGIRSLVFAATPFAFEGEERQRNARGAMPMIADVANSTFFLPLDKLVENEDNMNAAMSKSIGMVASCVTLFWRMLEKPGYIRMDSERLLPLLTGAEQGRVACVTVQGPNRAAEAVDRLVRSELLTTGTGPVRAILCGVLAGDDLRLSELTIITDGLRQAFGNNLAFHLGTVNDEATFSGRISVVAMLFEGDCSTEVPAKGNGTVSTRRISRHGPRHQALSNSSDRGRFNNAEPTIWKGEDLDIPTFIRRAINLEP